MVAALDNDHACLLGKGVEGQVLVLPALVLHCFLKGLVFLLPPTRGAKVLVEHDDGSLADAAA